MKQIITTSRIIKIVIILSVLVFQSYAMNAQIRTRTTQDSIIAQLNGYWFNPSHYQFEVQYPKLQVIPPLSTGMDFETLLAYVYLDSLMRSTNKDMIWQMCLQRWYQEKTKNDTIIQAVKYLYKLKDYDPIRFRQYSQSTSKPLYKFNLVAIQGIIDRLLYNIVLNTQNQIAMVELNNPDYIFKVHVNSIDSIPRRGYPNDTLRPNEFVYQVNATVLDTLKGKVFQQCNNIQPLSKKDTKNKALAELSNICFIYGKGPYYNEFNQSFNIDPVLLNTYGNLSLTPGQDLIVFLDHGNYYWDYDFDYFQISLLTVFPIINGQVIDISHVWSNSNILDYSDWKNAFLQKRDMLLNGGY